MNDIGLWIPPEIMTIPGLPFFTRAVFAEICNLNKQDVCFASNEYLANFFGVSKRTIIRAIADLKSAGLIEVDLINGISRTMHITSDNLSWGSDNLSWGYGQNVMGGSDNLSPKIIDRKNRLNNNINNICTSTTPQTPLLKTEDEIYAEMIAMVVEGYNKFRGNMPKCEALSDTTKNNIKRLIHDLGAEDLIKVIKFAGTNNFLQGTKPVADGKKTFVASLDWLMNPNNAIKVLNMINSR